ncbi:uncharacterized protein MYCFIDRAFT_65382 [Pseudocercospora fijiensis CIRAD86]|uniref:Cupin 2 conserved barrel domain-containing protein n=1 Tax=Pseudocercospora fijiensis (strain CIRAD86) TaxID=383855 RepID=M2YGH8_PSEFD|nr:uncharacterized protein MYCFIDRAFT_65382 [Pseudocercospora fijiensis CIRAD86]EME76905.1 hypothetical protein MYCFIDRAFT_65382 [Pseudocercospora fijiensis CIRAD86]
MHYSKVLKALCLLAPAARASLWVDKAPSSVRPYVIEHYANANALTIGSQTFRFPVTGPSSGNKLTILMTSAPESGDLSVLPHIHEKYHENFCCFKGRVQLWAHKCNDTEARLLTAGDFGSVPVDTTHTFQTLDPDTEIVGVVAPGSFEDLFYFLATQNVSYETQTPYTPVDSGGDAGSGTPAEIISQLASFDVHAALNFTPPRDLVNGSRPAGAIWHDGNNNIPSSSGSPYFIALNWGPKYLNNSTGAYQIVQPFVTPVTGEQTFTEGTITLGRRFPDAVSPTWNLTDHLVLIIVEGAIDLTIANETATLLGGDVAFVPGGTPFSYGSKAAFSKFLYVSAGVEGLDQQLLADSGEWNWPVFPVASP